MKPFLEIPIGISNVDKEEKTVQCRLQPESIDYYYPGFFWGSVIVLKSGSSILTLLTFAELDAAITQYLAFEQTNPGKFGNLAVKPVQKETPRMIVT